MKDIHTPVRAHMTSLAPQWHAWLKQVPSIRDAAVRRWNLEMGPLIARSVSSEVHRVRVRGRAAVLKLCAPTTGFSREVATLVAANGRGYAHVYEHDAELGALLMESLGHSYRDELAAHYGHIPPALTASEVDLGELLGLRARVLQEAWTLDLGVAPEVDASNNKATALRGLMDRLHRQLGLAEFDGAVERGLLYAGHRADAFDASRLVVCHGDPHSGNLLQVPSPRPGAPDGYVWVDPDGFRCDPEYDLGVLMRESSDLILAADDPVVLVRGWCARLADVTDTDAEAIWQWSYLERVSSGLYLIDQGWPDRGRPFLEAATWLIGRRGA